MHWIAPSEKDRGTAILEKRLWDAADQFRANSGLKAQEYSAPVLGLIFLRFAEVRFIVQRTKLELQPTKAASSRRSLGEGGRSADPAAYHAAGNLYLLAEARFDYLLNLAAKTLVVPPAELCQRFGDFAAPLARQILKLERQNQYPRRTRDYCRRVCCRAKTTLRRID